MSGLTDEQIESLRFLLAITEGEQDIKRVILKLIEMLREPDYL